MKFYEDRNHYELLEIHPDVTAAEIRHAYKSLFDLYQNESVAIYSFFSDVERKEILSRLEKAYLTLIDPETRKEYDFNLIEIGQLRDEWKQSEHHKNPSAIYDFKKTHLQGLRTIRNSEEIRQQVSQNQVIKGILNQDTISGKEIKLIRSELNITLDEIAEATKVRIEMLRIIEEDKRELFLPMVYMTGFLKQYTRYLQLDENVIVNGFIKYIEEGKQQ